MYRDNSVLTIGHFFKETAALSQKQNPRHDKINQSRLVHTIQQPTNTA